MEDFPANSQFPRAKEIPEKKEEPKKVEQITTGPVKVRKKPLGRRFLDTFLAGSMAGVGQYVLLEVIVPAIRDVIADTVSQGAERLIYGEARSSSRRTGQRPGGSGGYISYNRYASTTAPWKKDREDPRPALSRHARATHNFNEIVLNTRVEVEEVIDRLYELISQYGQATVSDLYDLCGISWSFTDEKWGWTQLKNAEPQRVTGGYLIKLPRPEQLD
jgi:hypothetical protein